MPPTKTVTIGPWTVAADVENTAHIYKETKRGSPADCTCKSCHNFLILDEKVFPVVFHTYLLNLGVDFHKAAEIHEWSPPTDSFVLYGGWFHCIGRIVRGDISGTAVENVNKWPWHEITREFEIVLDDRRDLAFSEFYDLPLVRIEFRTKLPLVIHEKEVK